MAKFTIDKDDQGAARLTCQEKLSVDDFDAIASQLGVQAKRAERMAMVAAFMATKEIKVDTIWNGETTSNTAKPGDWIVTNMHYKGCILRDDEGRTNQYVVSKDKFPTLYIRAPDLYEIKPDTAVCTDDTSIEKYGVLFNRREDAIVDCLFLARGLDIVAPWKESVRQRIKSGYLLRQGADVYGNDKRSFEGTYRIKP
jgi:hypothetical protein